MTLHESESVKYLFDHIKSVWTLSAGGLAAGVALFAYIIKESQHLNAVTVLLGVGCVVGLVLYAYSIWSGVTSQSILIEDVRKSETTPVDVSKVSVEVITRYRRGRRTFFWGCISIVLAALIFLLLNAWTTKSRSRVFNIAASNIMLTTTESKTIKLQDLIRCKGLVTEAPANPDTRINDVIFKVTISENN